MFGGVETHLWDISTRLVNREYQILCLVGGNTDCFDKYGKLNVVRRTPLTVQNLILHRKGLPKNTISSLLLEELIHIVQDTVNDFSPSLIHIHNAHHFAPELAMATLANDNLPFMNSVHDRVGEHVYPDVINYNWDHVLYASNYLKKSIPTCRISSVLHLGIDIELFSEVGDIDQRLLNLQRPIIFHPARLLQWKGVKVSLQAFLKVRKRLGQGSLVLCASENIVDDLDEVRSLRLELETMASNHDACEALHFLTFDRSEIASAYRASDIIWYPTIDDEPYGLVPLEAMACGVPIVVSQSGGMLETVVNGETGYIVPKNNSDILAEKSVELLLNAANLRRLVKRAREYVRQFDIESYMDQLEKVYKSLRRKNE